eukprot:207144-Chlamydomonas_euryale.AAC.1
MPGTCRSRAAAMSQWPRSRRRRSVCPPRRSRQRPDIRWCTAPRRPCWWLSAHATCSRGGVWSDGGTLELHDGRRRRVAIWLPWNLWMQALQASPSNRNPPPEIRAKARDATGRPTVPST